MLERALGNENKWQRDIGDWWRQNLITDVVSVVVTVVIVYTVKPLPLRKKERSITAPRNRLETVRKRGNKWKEFLFPSSAETINDF